MDLQRTGAAKSRWATRAVLLLFVIAAVYLGNGAIARFLPNKPTVDSELLVMDTVRRGEFVHEIRCVGQLVSTRQHEIPASTVARVQRIVALPGVDVQPDTLILELVNPELDVTILDAESKQSEAEATLITEKARFESQLIQLKSALSKLESEHAVAQSKFEIAQGLFKKNAFQGQQLKYREITARGLQQQRDLAAEAYQRYERSRDDHLAVFREKVSQAKNSLLHAKTLRKSLEVRAGIEGVLAQVPVTVGQQLDPGELLAKVVDPKKLKAELRVPEVEARYIKVGQTTKVDTRHGIITGIVTRVEPEVREGSVTIDVVFADDRLPDEARPDLSITGLIEVNRLSDVLFVGRPASALADANGSIFRCEVADTKKRDSKTHARRTPVQFGIASANEIVVCEGLVEGDCVILSDLPEYQDVDELLIN